MDEALEILWTYARREPLDSNGETVVPTINNSIAAIRIIMRLEGWAMGSEKRKIPNKPTRDCRGKVRKQFAQPHSAQSQFTEPDTDNNNDDNNNEPNKYDDKYTEGELLTYSAFADFAPTPAQYQ